MNKLFELAQAKGKWHKFHSFNLGGGAKLYKNFAQKLLAVSLCMAVVLLGTPVTSFAGEPLYTLEYEDGTNAKITGVTADDYSAVTTIEIPASVTDIAKDAFDQCTSLATFTVVSGNSVFFTEAVDSALYSKDKTTLYRLSPAFAGTYNLPTAVTKIKDGAFTNCSKLTEFDLGYDSASVTWSDYSFTGCSALASFAGVGRGPYIRAGKIGGRSCFLLNITGSEEKVLRVAPAAVGPLVVLSTTSTPSSLGSALNALPSVAPALLLGSVLSAGSNKDFAALAGAPVLVPAASVSSLSLGASPASVLAYEVGGFVNGRTQLLLTGRKGDTTKPLTLACDSFEGYKLAVKDGVTIDNLSLSHHYSGGVCTACGAADPAVPVTGVTLSESMKSLDVGNTFDLTATVYPEDATNKNVTWTSSDASIATVSGDGLTGTVQALKAGTATITVTTEDGNKQANCQVTVTSDDDDPEDPDDPGDFPPTLNPPAFGSARPRAADGHIQYVNSAGRTAVPLDGDALDDAGVLWLHEESAGSTAWYGLDLSTGAFELTREHAFYVQWLSPSDAEYDTYYSQLDDAQKARVEHNNGWIFLLGVTDISGNKIQPASPVNVYVQIGDDWDVDDLNAYYIASGADESLPVDYLLLDYPEGSDTFGRLTLDHFSPYFIFDELTADEKATLVQENSGPENNVKTGDQTVQVAVAGLGITLVLALGIMLRSLTSKRQFED